MRQADLDRTQFLCGRTAPKRMVVLTTSMIKISILVQFLPCIDIVATDHQSKLCLTVEVLDSWCSPGLALTAPLACSHYARVRSHFVIIVFAFVLIGYAGCSSRMSVAKKIGISFGAFFGVVVFAALCSFLVRQFKSLQP